LIPFLQDILYLPPRRLSLYLGILAYTIYALIGVILTPGFGTTAAGAIAEHRKPANL